MIRESERYVVTRDLPDSGLRKGDIGVAVLLHLEADSVAAVELEIFAANGETIDVVTAPADALRPVEATDRMSVRSVAAE